MASGTPGPIQGDCLCLFCGSYKRKAPDECPECSRTPVNEVELARSLLLSSPPVDVDGQTVGVERSDLEATARAVRQGEATWSQADINAALQIVRGLREGSPWWSNLVVYGGFAVSVVFLVWISWLFVERLVEFLE